MKKFVFSILFIFMASYSYANVYTNIASDLVEKLHIVKGKISNIHNKEIVLDKGYADGVYKNSIVYIYRNEGKIKLFNDNKTVDLKKGIAYAYATKVYEHKTKAIISAGFEKERNYLVGLGIIPWGEKPLMEPPKVGYNFVLGKKQYRIALITRNPIIYSSLKEALEKTDRFYVIDPDTLSIAITKKRINSFSEKDSIKELSEAVNADLAMVVSVVKHKIMKCKVYNGYAGNVILSLQSNIDKQSETVLSINKNNTSIPAGNIVASNLRLSPKLTFWESLLNKAGLYSPYTGLDMSSAQYKITLYKEIGYGTTAFYLGRINNNQEKAILVAKGSRVSIYGFDFDSFIKKGSFSYGYNIFNIDSAEIGGKTVVVLSNFNQYGGLDSAIGYIDKHYKFHVIKDGLPYHLRFYDKFSNPKILAQRTSVSKLFRGDIYVMDINTGSLNKLNLPVAPKSFYDFEKIDNDIAYISKSGQLCLYSMDMKKIVQRTAYVFGGGERAIERYHYEPNNEQTVKEVEEKNSVYVPKGIVFFKEKGEIYALGARNYMSRVITINKQHYNAYSLKLLKYNIGKFELEWSSGDVKGRIVGFGKFGDYVISVIGTPAGFFDRFIRGIMELDRLSAGQIEY